MSEISRRIDNSPPSSTSVPTPANDISSIPQPPPLMSRLSPLDLPLDCIARLCQFLPLSDLFHVRETSQHFSQAACRPEVWLGEPEDVQADECDGAIVCQPKIVLKSNVNLRTLTTSPVLKHARWLCVEFLPTADELNRLDGAGFDLHGVIFRRTKVDWFFEHQGAAPPQWLSRVQCLKLDGVDTPITEKLLAGLPPTIRTLEIVLVVDPKHQHHGEGVGPLPSSLVSDIKRFHQLKRLIISHPSYRRNFATEYIAPNPNVPDIPCKLEFLYPHLRLLASVEEQHPTLKVLEIQVPFSGPVTEALMKADESSQSDHSNWRPPRFCQVKSIMISGIAVQFSSEVVTCFDGIERIHLVDCVGAMSELQIPRSVKELAIRSHHFIPEDVYARPKESFGRVYLETMLHNLAYADHEMRLEKFVRYYVSMERLYTGNIQSVSNSIPSTLTHLELPLMCNYDTTEYFALLPNIRILRRIKWPYTIYPSDRHPTNLALHFPELRELHVEHSVFPSAWEARHQLLSIPHLRSIEWKNEPPIHPSMIDSYYSLEAIATRRRKLKESLQWKFEIVRSIEPSRAFRLAPAASLSSLSLALIFHFLLPKELLAAQRACRNWRVAAVSPLVLRPNIRVRMDEVRGAVVQGTQITFSRFPPMLAASQSMVFKSIRVVTLGSIDHMPMSTIPRESTFHVHHLNRLELLTEFHSLHTLQLDWSEVLVKKRAGLPLSNQCNVVSIPETYLDSFDLHDAELIARVFQSPSLAHLKVLRVCTRPLVLMSLMPLLKFLSDSLEVFEMRVTLEQVLRHGINSPDEVEERIQFLPLLELRQLRHAYFSSVRTSRERVPVAASVNDVRILSLFLTRAQSLLSSFEAMHFRPVFGMPLIHHFTSQLTECGSEKEMTEFILPFLRSITVQVAAADDLPEFSSLFRCLPDLTNLTISKLVAPRVSDEARLLSHDWQRLHSLKINFISEPALSDVIRMMAQCPMPQLQRFHLIASLNPRSLTEESAIQLALALSHMSQLTDVLLHDLCHPRIDAALATIAPQLEHLADPSSNFLSNHLHRCQALRTLSIISVSSMTSDDVDSAARFERGQYWLSVVKQLPRLESFVFSRARPINGMFVATVSANELRRLEFVSVSSDPMTYRFFSEVSTPAPEPVDDQCASVSNVGGSTSPPSATPADVDIVPAPTNPVGEDAGLHAFIPIQSFGHTDVGSVVSSSSSSSAADSELALALSELMNSFLSSTVDRRE